jgi:hypothetical protein
MTLPVSGDNIDPIFSEPVPVSETLLTHIITKLQELKVFDLLSFEACCLSCTQDICSVYCLFQEENIQPFVDLLGFAKDSMRQERRAWSDERSVWLKRDADWLKRGADSSWKLIQDAWTKTETSLRRDLMTAKGMFSSRGVFERVLEIVAIEQGWKGKVTSTEVCRRLGNTTLKSPSGMKLSGTPEGELTNVLVSAIKKCANVNTEKEISDSAVKMFSTLSKDIHGSPWDTQAIRLSDDLDDMQKCILKDVLVAMKLW